MRSNYKRLGDYIREFSEKNNGNKINRLLGVSNEKYFMPSIANINGTDLSKYKTIKQGQFAYGPVTSRNGDKISIALLEEDEAIVSTSYITFEIIDHNLLLPEYLILWFKRPEFDRYARFMSHGSVREIFDWEKMCNVILPIPDIEIQRKLVREYRLIDSLIKSKKTKISMTKAIIQTLLMRESEVTRASFSDINGLDIISSGIDKFTGNKIYLATADVNDFIESYKTTITYKKRPSRANMQPVINSVWIAKMKDAKKQICFDSSIQYLIDTLILSTGFLGFKVDESKLYLINAILESEDFLSQKDNMSTGTTMQAINNESLNRIQIKIFSNEVNARLNFNFKYLYRYIFCQFKLIELFEKINELTIMGLGSD